MTRFSANIGFLFAELPYLDRFAAAAEAGFAEVEFGWPMEPPQLVARAVDAAGLRVALLNAPAGDLAAGERGWPNDPRRMTEWRAAFDEAVALAMAVGCPAINALAGNRLDGLPDADQLAAVRQNLSWALERSEGAGTMLLLEVLNPVDTPRYLLADLFSAVELVGAMDHPRLRLQFDTYHLAMLGHDPAEAFASVAPLVGHIQVADVPGRGAPGTGALDFVAFFDALASARYEGAVGLEYLSRGDTRAALAWLPTAARGGGGEPFSLR